MLPLFIICWKSVGDEMLPKRIFSIFCQLWQFDEPFCECNCLITVLAQEEQYSPYRQTQRAETRNLGLIVSHLACHPTLNMTTFIQKQNYIFFFFRQLWQQRTSFFGCLFAFIHCSFFFSSTLFKIDQFLSIFSCRCSVHFI